MVHNCSYGEPESKEGDVVCYGQPVALVTLPEEGGQVRLLCLRSIMTNRFSLSLITAWSAQ